ncbi:hypothetical protein AB4Z48_22190 [Cupriavidus sp. 2TAF22]|uniref:hypothetical protein n=1 Tax=unclassified Cupriavidus TaxID=2640874 RepID=UPI003F8E00BA
MSTPRCGPQARRLCVPLAACLMPLLLVAACQGTPAQPKIEALAYTIKLGHISAKTAVGTMDAPGPGAFDSSVSVAAANGGGWNGGAASVGVAVNLNQLFHPQPRQQVDLYQYKVTTEDGTVDTVNGPAAPGLDPGACVRLIYPDGTPVPRMVPSSEC